MILTPKMISTINAALTDFEQSTGTERAGISAIKLAATMETVLAIAGEEQNMTITSEGVVISPYKVEEAPNTTEPQTETQTETDASEVDLDEDVEAMDADTQKLNTYQQIMAMKQDGKKVAEIAKFMGISVSSVYNYIKFGRDQEAK